MSFKKNGTDPEFSRKAILPGLPGGPSWAAAVHVAAQAVGQLVQSLFDNRGIQPEEIHRHRRSKRPQQKRHSRPNMLTISKRVRRKHRRAAA